VTTMLTIHKYPRTQHIEGSRFQPGDEDLKGMPFRDVAGRFLVVEEKLDGANAGLRFDADGKLWLQSRGHFLTGGSREKHFNLYKQWAHTHAPRLREVLTTRYALFGEWLYAKHTIFYDQLPHYFLEFDVLDVQEMIFLDTVRRRHLLQGLPIVSVPVLHEGAADGTEQLRSMVRPSLYKSAAWKDRLRDVLQERGLDPERMWDETDVSDHAEGLYIKVEEHGRVVARYKFIRQSFLTAVLDSETHWLQRPIVPNQLAAGVDLFGGGT
jgi:RNA ligase